MRENDRHAGRHVAEGAEVRLIAADGSQVGFIPMGTAVSMARAAGLDAVVVNADAKPPVVRLMDDGKRKYEDEKRRRKAKRNASGGFKEIRFTVDIGDHDVATKTRRIDCFLDKGMVVQLVMVMRGRTKSRPQIASDRLRSIADGIISEHDGCTLSPQSRNGNRIACSITPSKHAG